MMRILYHFANSPFARRVRLALAHKGLEAELREARQHPEFFAEMKQRTPFVTVPCLVEADGRVLGDSTAICHYLDRAYSDRSRLWPTDEPALVFELTALVDDALDTIVTTGNRFYRFHDHAGWADVQAIEVARIQRALDGVAERLGRLDRPTIAPSGWSAADIWVYTAAAWLRRLPARAETFPLARQLVALGWSLPEGLAQWAAQHDDRSDVAALETW